MAILSVIKHEGPNNLLVWKAPHEDFNTKSQLIVHESQEAVFFKNGQALDTFGPGRHTLDTQNIPLLRKLINLPFGGDSPFHCEVYFINKVHSMDIRWGTANHIPIQDPVHGVILPIGANGQFAVQVTDSSKLLTKLVGTIPAFTHDELISYFRGILMTNIKDYIAKKMVQDKLTFLEVHAHLKEISDALAADLQEAFDEYGIRLVNFCVNAIIIPENDPSYIQLRQALSRKAEMGILGYTYHEQRTFDVLEGAAKNEGGGAAFIGAGMGLGMGAGMGGFMNQAMGKSMENIAPSGAPAQTPAGTAPTAPQTQAAAPAQTAGAKPGMTFCPHCGEMVPEGKFCCSCGQPLVKPKRFCPECGTEAVGRFCVNCGTKIDVN